MTTIQELSSMTFIKPLTNDWDNDFHYKGTVEHYETLKKEFKFLKENKKRKQLNKWKKTHGLQYLDYKGKWVNTPDSEILDDINLSIRHST